jgi:hypothetical protein
VPPAFDLEDVAPARVRPGEANSVHGRFCPRDAQANPLGRRDVLGDPLTELERPFVYRLQVEPVPRLRRDRLDDVGMAVPEHAREVIHPEVDVLVPVRVANVRPGR